MPLSVGTMPRDSCVPILAAKRVLRSVVAMAFCSLPDNLSRRAARAHAANMAACSPRSNLGGALRYARQHTLAVHFGHRSGGMIRAMGSFP